MTTTTTPTRDYRRRVSHVERSYLNALAQGSAATIQLVLEGQGHLDPVVLQHAVDVASAANRGMRVVRRGAWWKAGGEEPTVQVIEPSIRLQDNNFDDPRVHAGFDIVRGPVCGVLLQHQPDGTSTLIFRTSHAVSDGRGLEHWTKDVFRVLRGEEPVGSDSVLTDKHFADQAAATTGRVGEFEPYDVGSFASPFTPPDRVPTGLGTPVWTRRRIDGKPSPAMAARLAVAVARSVRRRSNGPEARVVIPVDMRRHDKSVVSTANLSAPIFLDVDTDAEWSTVHGELLLSLMSAREAAPLVSGYRGSNGFAQTLDDAAGGTQVVDTAEWHPCTAVISDHGTVPLDGYRSGDFAAESIYTLPMLVPYSAMFVSAFGTATHTNLTICHRDRPDAVATANSILDTVQELLA